MADGADDRHGPVFACPVRGQPLPRSGQVFRCANGHAFDVAREGHVNLLLAQYRRSRDPGYSKEIAGRRDFFDAGHYQPLADGIAELVDANLPDRGQPVVLDAGCGEGYYLRRHKLALRGPAQVANLLLMTRYYWSASPQARERLACLDNLDTEVDVTVQAYQRTGEPPDDTESAGG